MDQQPPMPLIFVRTDLDALEDAYQALFDAHHRRRKHDPETQPECAAMEEHMREEEATEKQIKKICRAAEEPPAAHTHESSEEDDELLPDPTDMHVSELIEMTLTRPPLVRDFGHFAQEMGRWTDEVKEKDAGYAFAFRLKLNAFGAAMRVLSAQHEETHEDSISFAVAAKEYEVATVYMDRAVQSAKLFSVLVGVESERLQRALDAMPALLEAVKQSRLRCLRLSRRGRV